ncbi:MAG: transposase, partial [Bacteroidota bacterium]
NQIPKSKVVGSDETECQLNGKKGWIWTWQTNALTYLRFSNNRGEKTLLDVFPNGLPNSIVVHDSYATQFMHKCKGHQMCLPHLIRELNYFIEKGDQWSAQFKQQLKAAITLYHKIKKYPEKNFKRSINRINKNIDQLLVGKKSGKGLLEAFKDRMRKKRKALLRFLDDPHIPHDNNGSERAVRNIKVKTKISGMFKTEIGADQFAVIRSVIDTFIKRDQPVLTSLFSKLSAGT